MITVYLILFALAPVIAQTGPNELNDRALKAADTRQFETAEKLFNESIALWRAQGAEYDLHAAFVQNNLAQMYCAMGDRKRCSATLEQALPVFRRALGVKDQRTLTVMNLLGAVSMMLGDHTRATALFQEALPIERALYPNSAELGRSLSGLASLAMEENRAAEGAPIAEEALAVAIKAEGDESLDAALAYANMAEAHRVLGRLDRAEPLFRKARAIYEKQLGPEHQRVSSVLTQEGLIALQQNKLATAEQAFTRALAIVTKTCPDCVYERVAAENDMALLRIRQGDLAAADELLADVLKRQEQSGSVPPAEIAVTLNSLATVAQRQKRYEDAERLKRRAAIMTASYR
jgi:tetratricopeptide (TPR) repeat protein